MTDAEQELRRRTDEAAAWFTRLNTSDVPTTTLEGFFAWRRDPSNRAAYARIEAISGVARTLRDDPEIRAAVVDARRRSPWWRPLALGFRRRRGVFAAGLLAAAGVAALLLLAPGLQGERYATGVGEQASVTLSDGSAVRLDTDSAVRVRYGKAARQVVLERGQAFFEVAHDAARPFSVEADGAHIQDLGTRFDVRRTGGAVVVTLAEGRIQVTPGRTGGRSWTLRPGEQLRLGRGDAQPTLWKADLETSTAWTSGRLLFRNAPLAAAVAEVNRYSRRKIVLAAGTPGDVRVNGAFNTGDVEGFASAAADSLGLAVTHRDGAIELHPRRGGPT